MCLGIPGKVIRTFVEHDVLMGKVDFGGVSKQVCLEHVRDVQVGQYVLVHVGFALSKIDQDEAGKVFEFLASMNQLDELAVQEAPSPATPANADGPAPFPGIADGLAPPPGIPGNGRGEGNFDRNAAPTSAIQPNSLSDEKTTQATQRASAIFHAPGGAAR